MLCEAQAELAAKAAKPVQEFPIFLDYEDDVYAAVEAAIVRRPRPPRCRSPASRSARTASTRSRTPSRPQLAERVRGPREGALRRLPRRAEEARSASASCATRSASTAVASPTSAPLGAEVEVLPRVHGSAIFERGETQIMGVTTLNMLRMEQQLDTLSPGDAQALHAQLQLPALQHR